MTIVNLSSSDESLGRDGGGLKDDGSLSFSLTLSTTEESLGREVSSAMVEEVSSDLESKDKGHVKIDFANEGNRLDLPLIPAYEWAPHEPRNYKTSNERVCHGREGTKLDFFLRLCLLLPGPPFDSAFQRLADGCPKGNQLRSHPNPPERLGFHAGVQCFMPTLKSLVDLFLTLYKGFKTDFFKVSITRCGRKWFFDEVDRPKFPLYWTQVPPTIDLYFEKLMTPVERADLVVLKQLPDKLSTRVKAHWKFVRSSSMPPRLPIRPPPLINEPILEPDALTAKKDLAIAREEVKEIKVSVVDLSKWFNQLNLIKSEHAKCATKLKEGTDRLKEATNQLKEVTNQLKEVTNQLKEEQDRGRNAVDDIRKLQQRFDDLSLEYLSMKQSIETWEKKCQELEFELLIVDDQVFAQHKLGF
ncbi:hypothetical protein DEO72_LG1g2619 [Vigna unguiculata]|uniref:Uncharacterized protein n=1 Tax=Vigna unguiculata TaxID=3917 RepID=A0A4D6KN55_VIGUN|nr:hypothetical protein DEO72_LG1g2619 [Vigna unguiculata]